MLPTLARWPFNDFYLPLGADFSPTQQMLSKMNLPTRKDSYLMVSEEKSTDESTIFSFDVPGAKKQDIEIVSSDKYVDIKVTAKGRKYHSKYRVDDYYDTLSASATLEDGVLTLTIPANQEKKPKSINIEVK